MTERTRRYVLGATGVGVVGAVVGAAVDGSQSERAAGRVPAGYPASAAEQTGSTVGQTGSTVGQTGSTVEEQARRRAPGAPPSGTPVTVDFRRRSFPLDVWSIGGTILTQWGRRGAEPVTIVTDATWRARLGALGPLHWRIPLDMNPGAPSSSERLGGTADGARYLRAIRSIGGTPYPIIQGNPRNDDFSAAQVSAFVHYFNDNSGARAGGRVRRLILGNEPDNDGAAGVANYLANLEGWISAAKTADPAIRISAPASSHWGNDALLRDGAARYSGVDILGYHAYDGSDHGSGPPGFPETRHYHDDMVELRGFRTGLTGYGLEEVNFGNRLGTAPLYDWRNYVWLSSVIGQVITAGGNVSTFADLNGSFGMMNDGTGEDDQPGSLYTPFPSYWAVGMWTGMNGRFRRFGRWTVPAASTIPLLDVFATANSKIVLVNKDGVRDRTVDIGLGNRTSGRFSVWQSARERPTAGPTRTVSGAAYSHSVVRVHLPAGTVSSVELD
jgi:hypothetical protein